MAIALGQLGIPLLFVVVVVLSAAEAVVDSASIALVPATVDPDALEGAGARLMGTELVADGIVGSALGGALFAMAASAPFGFDAATFAVAALIMGFNRGASAPGVRNVDTDSIWARIRKGLVWLWRDALLRRLALISMVLGAATMMWSAVFVLYATQDLNVSATGFGFLAVFASIGGLLGSVSASKLAKRPLGVTLLGAVMTSGIALTGMAVATSTLLVSLLLMVGTAGVLVWNVLTMALRQRLIPTDMLGRVSAGYRFFVQLAMPIGAAAGGLLAYALGPRATLMAAGGLLILTSLAIPGATRSPTRSL